MKITQFVRKSLQTYEADTDFNGSHVTEIHYLIKGK